MAASHGIGSNLGKIAKSGLLRIKDPLSRSGDPELSESVKDLPAHSNACQQAAGFQCWAKRIADVRQFKLALQESHVAILHMPESTLDVADFVTAG